MTLTLGVGSLITIASGRAVIAGSGSRAIAVLGSSLPKFLTPVSVWAAGSNAGGRFAGTIAANQTWHVFVIRNTTTGAVDAGFDLSVSGANIPSGWVGRIIGSIMTDGSSNIRNFVQTGDRFDWVDPVVSFNGVTPTITTNLVTLAVPAGLVVRAIGRFFLDTTSTFVFASSPSVNADIFITTINTAASFEIPTNGAGQIKHYVTVASAVSNIVVRGFYHPRGAS